MTASPEDPVNPVMYRKLTRVNLRYITGFTGSSGLAVISDDQAVFITDFRYTEQAKDQIKSFDMRNGNEFSCAKLLFVGGIRSVCHFILFKTDFVYPHLFDHFGGLLNDSAGMLNDVKA